MRLVIALLLVIVLTIPIVNTTEYGLDKYMLLYFLRSQYIPSIGLLRASVYTYPDNATIYIANDNVLAARALAVLGDQELSSKILTKLNNEYNGGFNNRIEILFGIDIPDVFNNTVNMLIAEIDGYRIMYEKRGDKIIEDWHEYADLLVYYALDRLLWGSRPHAELIFLNLTKMWDGYGFRDKAFNATGVYATYKCALFIYLHRALESSGSDVVREYSHVRNKCIEIITLAQDSTTGGIRTDYRVENGRIVIEGDVNVETTSMAVLALYSDYPALIGVHVRPNPVIRYGYSLGYLVLTIVIAAFVFKFIMKFV